MGSRVLARWFGDPPTALGFLPFGRKNLDMHARAIETRYKGYRFRSRLEARWAVFFDALGLRWEYEPEGFELPGGVRYLPDFRVHAPNNLTTWFEVKPLGTPTDAKFAAFKALVEDPEDYGPVVAQQLCGDPVEFLRGRLVCPRCGEFLDRKYSLNLFISLDETGIDCPRCDATTPSGGDNPPEDGIAGKGCCYPHKGTLMLPRVSFGAWEALVYRAAVGARSARFEHGESGPRGGRRA